MDADLESTDEHSCMPRAVCSKGNNVSCTNGEEKRWLSQAAVNGFHPKCPWTILLTLGYSGIHI